MRKRVLIVDDDPGTRELLIEMVADLEGVEVDTVTASTDEEGYQRFLEVGPDLVLLDLLLPRKGGMALLRRIRELRGGREAAVIVMSAVFREGDARTEAVGELGALDFFRKPFHLPTVRTRLRQVLIPPEGQTQVEPLFGGAKAPARDGSLAAVELPVVLRNLGRADRTVCLDLRAGRVRKTLFFRDGRVVFALSNRLTDTLSRFLLAEGVIDEDTYRDGLVAMKEQGRRMGEYLVAEGVLHPDALHSALRQNLWQKCLDVFSWTEGEFRIGPFRPPPAEIPGPPFEVDRLVWEGVLEVYPFDRITAALAPYETLPMGLRGDLFDLAARVSLERDHLQFLHLVRRRSGETLGRILADAQGENEVRILYYLLVYGYLGVAEAGGGGLDLTEFERVRRARKELDALRRRNYFQVLGVGITDNDEAVRRAYLQKAKDYHPDVLSPGEPQALRGIYGEIFRLIQTAYDAIKTEARREEYLRFLQGGEAEAKDASDILAAEGRFQEGRLLLRRRQWDEAARAFEEALSVNPDEGEYVLHLGLARLRQAVSGREGALAEAKDLFRRAAELLPGAPEPWFRLGRLAALEGRQDEARRCFQETLRRDPRHTDALRELRRMDQAAEKRRGKGLVNLFRRNSK
ncbi:DUF4388 domain-containing protein [Deferrisoma camini]|uniref:DUF4388 domain-containing protein n=1 Tax=Deferrisoma camini TaxID=1035120 RepID=UPI00046C92E2|nr:DUF4388 domain-containing protein [Deferrisoma camini]